MIAVCPNPYRDTDLSLTRQIQSLLERAGETTVVCPVFSDSYDGEEKAKIQDVARDCSMAVVIGGDGTILAVARELYRFNIPIIGVNLGTKGFMASLEADEIEKIEEALKDRCNLSTRMMLGIQLVRNGEVIFTDCVLNDVVLRGYMDCIDVRLLADGCEVTAFSGDGIIVSTPTGSTGYSMSAGGPIVEPEANAFIISPICAHTMSAKSYVISSARNIEIQPGRLHDRKAFLSVDGRIAMDLRNGDVVRVNRSEYHTNIVDFGITSFYETTFQKLR